MPARAPRPAWLPLLLVVLAFFELRVDLRLLLDHFTWSSLLAGMAAHPLAVVVLLLAPSLARR